MWGLGGWEVQPPQTSGPGPRDEITPFVSMRIRHRDFDRYCWKGERYFAPLSTLVDYVQRVREETTQKTNIVLQKILVTSDEKDPAWWEGIKDLGWE